MSTFTPNELTYLTEQCIGRLATLRRRRGDKHGLLGRSTRAAPRHERAAEVPVRISSGRVSDPERGVRRRGERRPEEAAGTRESWDDAIPDLVR